MKEIKKEDFKAIAKQSHLSVSINYYGKKGQIRVNLKKCGKSVGIKDLCDEEVLLLWQVVEQAHNLFTRERYNRDLIPDEVRKLLEPQREKEETT